MRISSEPIPKNRMRQFHEILCATGGRYASNPMEFGDVVRVDYYPGDYAAQCEAWNRIVTPITEVRKDQVWRHLMRRFSYVFNCRS